MRAYDYCHESMYRTILVVYGAALRILIQLCAVVVFFLILIEILHEIRSLRHTIGKVISSFPSFFSLRRFVFPSILQN